jgi:hypothetical protein
LRFHVVGDNAGGFMKNHDPGFFHKLYGARTPRVTYFARDFIDYVLMIAVTALVAGFAYGFRSAMAIAAFVLCAFMIASFIMRHGIAFKTPVILRKPQEVLYMFAYKLQNLKSFYFIALGALLLENFLVMRTPNLPHHDLWMRKTALYLFYIHFLLLTVFRTVLLVDHLAKKELVREVLMQTAWRRAIKNDTNMTLEILHAYGTGILTHIILIAPWYLVITYSRFSLLFLPAFCILNFLLYARWVKAINAWFYRDHWLGHNSEVEFVLLHGTHHDAIPSGLIAVGENGFLEGFLRFTIGAPGAFFDPITAFVVYTYEIQKDIYGHQYIPGVFPKNSKRSMEVYQHSTHHYGALEPYSFAFKVDRPEISEEYRNAYRHMPDEMRNSAKLDEELTGFKWDNPIQRKTLSLYDQYQKK